MMGGDGDYISGLPDEILESILSRLTMKEAGCTSVLSRRWKYLWEFRTGTMNFDFGKKIMRTICDYFKYEILEAERARYASRVSNIISRHRGNTIEEFRVECDLKDHHPQIDSWIEFAMNKRVQRLELRLEPVTTDGEPADLYGFYRLPPLGSGLDISCLRSLSLHFVNTTGEQIEYILSNCELLEYLAITFSMTLVKSTVVTPCSKLKHLELNYCLELEELDIYSAPNLTTFVLTNEARFRLRNVPKLSHVSLSGSYYDSIVDRFQDLPISLSQLQKLTLMVDSGKVPEFLSFPELKNLKELELIWVIRVDKSLFSYTRLMKACPNLSRLLMEFQWWTYPGEEEAPLPSRTKGGIHKNLKDLELVRFRGDAVDMELVTYIFCNSPNIEKFKVTRSPYIFHTRVLEEDIPKDFVTYLAQELSPNARLLLDES
jgi:hypothetical protein